MACEKIFGQMMASNHYSAVPLGTMYFYQELKIGLRSPCSKLHKAVFLSFSFHFFVFTFFLTVFEAGMFQYKQLLVQLRN